MTAKRVLVIDFETQDTYIKKLGDGWVHGMLGIIGAAFVDADTPNDIKWSSDINFITNIVMDYDVLVCHNAHYDVGILKMLGVDIDKFVVVDTMVLGRFKNNTLQDREYSLNEMSKRYLGYTKTSDEIGLKYIRHRMHPLPEKSKRKKGWKAKAIKDAHKKAMGNLMELYLKDPKVVIKYAKQDVKLTLDLFNLLKEETPVGWFRRISNNIKLMVNSRYRGIPVDIKRVIEVRDYLKSIEDKELKILQSMHPNGVDFNPNSPKQLADGFDMEGIPYPMNPPTANDRKKIKELESKKDRTIIDELRIKELEKGRPSITREYLDNLEYDHPFVNALKTYRKYNKARRDFCDTLLATQELLPENKRGRVYPKFTVLGARTGRFTCSLPNIQQIPARDKEIGPLIRSFYVPEEGEQWYSLDFSAQEPRLQVHYAAKAKVEGGDLMALEYNNNPNLDSHQKVADMAGVTRPEAKILNLGISYGMGINKLAKNLGTDVRGAKIILDKYNTMAPYLNNLNEKVKETIIRKGYIKSLLGRKLRLEDSITDPETGKLKTFERKAFNALIQGSAADQTLEALSQIYEAKIPIYMSVHDEINFSAPNREIAEKVKTIMENCVKLKVPMVTDIGAGGNWSEAK